MTTNPLAELSIGQLRRAIVLKEQIESLQAELHQLLNRRSEKPRGPGNRGKRSAATRAKMAAAQQARWAKLKTKGSGTVSGKPRRKMSAAGRARIAAAAKARWAKAKAAGKKSLGD